jgi:hypothetical protein
MKQFAELLIKGVGDNLDANERASLLLSANVIEGAVQDFGGAAPLRKLSQITDDVGDINKANIMVGNGKQRGDGWNGVGIFYPPVAYGSDTWNLVGVNNDVLQVGISATTGKLLAGAGSVVIGASGITITVPQGEENVGAAQTITFDDATDNMHTEIYSFKSADGLEVDSVLKTTHDSVSTIARAKLIAVSDGDGGSQQEAFIQVVSDDNLGTSYVTTKANYFGISPEGAVPQYGLDLYEGIVPAMVIGADSASNTRTNSQNKVGGWGIPHYTNAEEPMAVMWNYTTTDTNSLNIGGGSSDMNNATEIVFHTSADNVTTGASEAGRFTEAGNLTIQWPLIIGERAAPDTPESNYGALYIKSSDSLLYFKNDAGTEFSLTTSPAHTIASHSDTTATGAELETLTDGSDADALHIHPDLVEIDGTGTMTGALDISKGGQVLKLGADGSDATTRTNNTNKTQRMGQVHYANAEEDMALLYSYSTATENALNIGGGSSDLNASTAIVFWTAANQTTPTGTEAGRFDEAQTLTLQKGFFVGESAAAVADVANYGQFWVKSDTPNVPMFTDDAGTDVQLGAAGGGGAMGAHLVTITPSGVASVTISSISQDYEHLLLIGGGVSSGAAIYMQCRMNGRSGASDYIWARDHSDANTPASSHDDSDSEMIVGGVAHSTHPFGSDYYEPLTIYFPNYAETGISHSALGSGSWLYRASVPKAITAAGATNFAEAITSITLFADVGNLTGRFSLYGLGG